MYRPSQRMFAFRARSAGPGVRLEGLSLRYTAIAMIGLTGESQAEVGEVLSGDRPRDVIDPLVAPDRLREITNLGDAALVCWAARALDCPNWGFAVEHLGKLVDATDRHDTVEFAWALVALCQGPAEGRTFEMRDDAARRLMRAFDGRSALFAHCVGANAWSLRGHVACFADQVYPIYALARYHAASDQAEPLRVANRCAQRVCELIGPAGQWWWHYDVRTGRVIERYPVYAVHQDAMAPMALYALAEVGGDGHAAAIANGLAWLESSPELGGGTLIDEASGMIWRKVARREPRKFVRCAQALAARVHPALRWPGTDLFFPARVLDAECRPYHLGWLLHAWPAKRAQVCLEGYASDARAS